METTKLMLSKSKIKLIRSLHLKKYRKLNGLFVAEGVINVFDLLKSKLKPDSLYVTEKGYRKFKNELNNIAFEVITGKQMEMITLLKTPSDILAVFELPEEAMTEPKDIQDYILMLDNIKDPGNLGTIIRTADWFGIKNIVCSPETVDAFNPKVVQATMGSLARVNINYTDLTEFLKSAENINIYGAYLNGTPVKSVEKPGKGIIIIGSEAHGISNYLQPYVSHRITIPGEGNAESLNASVAAAILCYEFKR